MKRLFLVVTCFGLAVTSFGQKTDSTKSSGLGGLLKKANSVLKQGNSSSSSLTTDEIIAGLKEALAQGANKTGSKVSSVNGFFKDAAIKILMPDDVKKVETKLRALGMGKVFDQAVESMNHAAEDASKSAAPIFVSAIKQMRVQDAVDILKGTDTAATHYLKKSTTTELTNAFLPVVQSSLKKVDATKYWTQVFSLYNKVAPTPVNTNINEYVTEKALSGIFYYIGDEEKKIRTNPAARVTELLKKVFGQQ